MCFVGCAPSGAKPGLAVLATSPAALAPDASPGTTATLRLGAPPTDKRGALSTTEFEVTVAREAHGSDVSFRLLSGGEALEREVYESRPSAFRIVSAADDTFAPPLDLLRYPAREGDAWNWKGKAVYAGVSRDARADVRVSSQGGDVRSDVTLFVDTDSGRPPIRRDLVFWFRKGKGVVARSFGETSSRRPVGEAWRP